MSETERKFHLLFDEGCPLCVTFQQEIKRRDRRDRIVPVGFEDPRIRQLVPGMTQEQLRGSFHLILPDGRVLSGHRALPDLLRLLPGWSAAAWILRHAPGAEWISGRLYAWFASAHHR